MATAPEPGEESGRSQIWTIAAGLLAFALGFVGLGLDLGFHDIGDVAYRALQLFVLDGGALADPDGPADSLQINWVLQIARFLAPTVTIMAILLGVRLLFAEERRRRKIAATVGHTIVCGDDAAALALAENLREADRAVVLVTRAEPGGVTIPTVAGDPRRSPVLEAAGVAGARAIYACAEDSARNAAVALAALDRRRGSSAPLRAFAQIRSDSLVEALQVQQVAIGRPRGGKLDFFNLDDIAARVLLDRYPIGDGTPVVYGFGRIGQAVMRAVVRGPGSVPTARTLQVFGATDEEEVRVEAQRLEIDTRGWAISTEAADGHDGTVYVCLADEEEALSIGLRLAADRRRTVVVCLRRASPFREALGSGDGVQIFGLLDEACREDAIESDSIVDRAARTIHERYRAEARQRGQLVDENPSLVPWSDLPPKLKESNYAQVEHLGRKLQEIGAVLVTQRPATDFAFSEEELTRLARLEHKRWVNERLAAGDTWGPRKEGRFHPDLVDWANLPEESRQKDVDAVRRLPEVLASDGIFIVRRGPRSPTDG